MNTANDTGKSRRRKEKPSRGAYVEYRPILFHVSPMENAKSIEERGIVVTKGHSKTAIDKQETIML